MDEYRGYDIFSIDDSSSMIKAEPNVKHNSKNFEDNSEHEDEVMRHHFVEGSDDSYTSSIFNQESGFSPENTNMETINEESYDSLLGSHSGLNKKNSEKYMSKNKLNEIKENSNSNLEDSDSESLDDSISSESLSSSSDDNDDNEKNDENYGK